jgi:hypothetical protein
VYSWSTGDTIPSITGLLPGTYTICVTDANACSTCDTVNVSFATFADEKDPVNIFLNPNPADDRLFLSGDLPSEYHVTVTDITGRTVLVTECLSNSAISIETLSAGTYLFRLAWAKGTATRKFVKR